MRSVNEFRYNLFHRNEEEEEEEEDRKEKLGPMETIVPKLPTTVLRR